MPVKPPNSPDFACSKCGHKFRKSMLQSILKRGGIALPPRKCPRCGSTDIGRLVY